MTQSMRTFVSTLCVLTVFSIPPLAQAGLTVVADEGGVSALPYFKSLNPQSSQVDSSELSAPKQKFSEAQMLPVRTPSMTPGKVVARGLDSPMLQPMFLIGDDPLSRQWLTVRGQALREMSAVGLVVNVENDAQLNDLRQLAPGLQLAPASGEDLANRLKIEHYPVLLTSSSLEQ